MIPRSVRADIELFIEGGLAILRKIAAAGFDVLTARPKLSKWEKGALAVKRCERKRDLTPASKPGRQHGSVGRQECLPHCLPIRAALVPSVGAIGTRSKHREISTSRFWCCRAASVGRWKCCTPLCA